MTNILIRHCRARVIRRGGWSWGPDPRSLANEFTRALPGLLAAQLANLELVGTEDAEITTPLVVRVPLSIEELRELTSRVGERDGSSVDPLGERLARAMALALSPHLESPTDAPTADQAVEARPVATLPAKVEAPAAVLQALLNWRRNGALAACLGGFAEEALRSWHDALRRLVADRESSANSPELDLHDALRRAGLLDAPRSTLRQRLTLRLLAAVELIAQGAAEPDSPSIWATIDQLAPLDDQDPGERDRTHPDAETALDPPPESATEPPRRMRPADHPQGASAPIQGNAAQLPDLNGAGAGRPAGSSSGDGLARRASRGEIRISSALPFLMLGPLAKMGCLEMVRAGFLAAGRVELLPAFATALAYKALPEPSLGWLRESADRETAAAFAGLDEPLPDPDLHALEPHHAELASPLDAAIAQTVLEARLAGEPLLIMRAEGRGWLAIDAPGTFPIAWSETIEELCDRLAGASEARFLIPSEAASPSALSVLHRRGLRFITDAPPARGETWRRVRRGGESWWTNDVDSPEGALIRSARRLGEVHALGVESWRALAVGRRALSRADHLAWDRSLAIAAGVALAQIGWTLWHADEPTNSELVVERFGSLDAVARSDEGSIRIVLPLGRRSMDLAAAGLLDDVRNVPWLGDRAVTFGKG